MMGNNSGVIGRGADTISLAEVKVYAVSAVLTLALFSLTSGPALAEERVTPTWGVMNRLEVGRDHLTDDPAASLIST